MKTSGLILTILIFPSFLWTNWLSCWDTTWQPLDSPRLWTLLWWEKPWMTQTPASFLFYFFPRCDRFPHLGSCSVRKRISQKSLERRSQTSKPFIFPTPRRPISRWDQEMQPSAALSFRFHFLICLCYCYHHLYKTVKGVKKTNTILTKCVTV